MTGPVSGRAVVARDGRVEVAEMHVEAPASGEVRVRLHASGVCHTDHDLSTLGFPVVLGHEGAGVVDAVGEGVDDLRAGDRVLLTWAIACRDCSACARGAPHLCERWSPNVAGPNHGGHVAFERATVDGQGIYRAFHLGTLATHTVVVRAAVVPIPRDLPFASAATLGCAVQTGVGSVLNAARVQPGERAVVLGCGGVGINVVQGCRLAGASAIVAVDVDAGRLEAATRFGATHLVLASRDDEGLRGVAEEVRQLLGGGADHAFECTAVPELATAPLAMVRHGGTAVAVSGVERTVPVDMQLFEWDKTYLTPLYGQCDPARDFPRLFRAYERGELLLDELVTRTYTLDQHADAFEDMLAGRNVKGVIQLDPG